MHFGDRLAARIAYVSPLCIGLEPVLDKLPEGFSKDAEGTLQFSKAIIDAVADSTAALSVNLAFYELLGWEGMKVFWQTCAHAKDKGLIVIADAKRGDARPASDAYADAYLFEDSPVDAVTVNPYMGADAITPFIERAEKNNKGVYVLVKSDNPGAGELQDLPAGDEVVHEYLAQFVEGLGMHHIGPETNMSFVGAMIGATYPEELKYLRTLMPHLPFLIANDADPGELDDVRGGFLADGTGAIVRVSKPIVHASDGKDFAEAAAKAAKSFADKLKSL